MMTEHTLQELEDVATYTKWYLAGELPEAVWQLAVDAALDRRWRTAMGLDDDYEPPALPEDAVLLSMPKASEQFGYTGKRAKRAGGKWIGRLIKDGELWARRQSPGAKKWWFSRSQLAQVRRKLGR